MVLVTYLFGHREMADVNKTTAIVMVTPTVFIPFQLVQLQSVEHRRGTLNIVHPHWHQLLAVEDGI